jgi:hypothetical protein
MSKFNDNDCNENDLNDEDETRRRSLEEDGCCSIYYEKPSFDCGDDYPDCDGFDSDDEFDDEE